VVTLASIFGAKAHLPACRRGRRTGGYANGHEKRRLWYHGRQARRRSHTVKVGAIRSCDRVLVSNDLVAVWEGVVAHLPTVVSYGAVESAVSQRPLTYTRARQRRWLTLGGIGHTPTTD